MPKVVITGNSTKVTAARFGNDIVLKKKLVDAKITETHRAAPNKRVNGKQKDTEVLTLSAADQKALRTTDTAALASAKIEHAKDKKKYIEWATNSYDKRAADAAAKVTEKADGEAAVKAAAKERQSTAKKRIMEGSAKTAANPETKKIMKKYKSQAKLIPKKGYPVPAMK